MIRLCKHPSQNRCAMLIPCYSLRLWLYRSLGITLEQDPAGNYNKATVSNTKKGDVHVVNMEPGKFSKHFYADYLWSTMQG